MTTTMTRPSKTKIDPRIFKSWLGDWFSFWLAGPGRQSWDEWRKHYLLASLAWAIFEGNEQEDAESRRRILALMENLFRLDQLSKRKNLRKRSELDALRTAINKGLRLYPVMPRVILKESNGWELAELPVPVERIGWTVVRVLEQERNALTFLRVQCEAAGGWPPQLRRCAICNNWFWGNRPWARVCTTEACKTKAKHQYQTSEAYKKNRKENYKNEIKRSKRWLTNPPAQKEKKR